jgi:hypothetical protein
LVLKGWTVTVSSRTDYQNPPLTLKCRKVYRKGMIFTPQQRLERRTSGISSESIEIVASVAVMLQEA